jgi:hypothetical protein
MDENPLPPLPCEAILFRAIINSGSFKKDGSPKPQIFIRRREADPNGLSITDTIQHCKESMPSGLIFGVRSVHIGTLRDNGFDVFPDSPTHGNLKFSDGTLTPRRQDNEPQANDVAELLMRCSRPIPYWDEEGADERFQAEIAGKIEAKRAAGIATDNLQTEQ